MYAKNVLTTVPAATSDSVDWSGVYTVRKTAPSYLIINIATLIMFK